MNEAFYVLDEGRIPVEDHQGNRELLGIRQLLKRAHSRKAISDASPMVEFSLSRFLAVFLMNALQPKDCVDLKELLEPGQFDNMIFL